MSKGKTDGHVRIIGGSLRGRRIPVAREPGLRPTSDRTRETLFNWLGHLAGQNVLDLFAGSGALGLEALSRGAETITLVEQNAAACRALRALAQEWKAEGVQVIQQEALGWLRASARRKQMFHGIFIDPPFEAALLQETVMTLHESALLANEAWIYLERARDQAEPEVPTHWHLHRSGQSRHTRYQLFQT